MQNDTAGYIVLGIVYFVYGAILGFLIGTVVTLATDKNGKWCVHIRL